MKRFEMSQLPLRLLILSAIIQFGCTASFHAKQGGSRIVSSVRTSLFTTSSLSTKSNAAPPYRAKFNTDNDFFKVTQSTLNLRAYYPACISLPVKIEITYAGKQSTCYTDVRDLTPSKPNDLNLGWANCQHAESVDLGTPGSAFLVRFFSALQSCDGYENEYQEAHPNGSAQADVLYTARAHNRLMEASQQSYDVKIDRATGAIFELYSKRARSRLNAIHTHVGAGIQVAFHDRDKKELTKESCAGNDVKYWNPNQAGAACLYRDGAPHMIASQPDANTTKSFLADGSTLLSTPSHNMMNWSYGPGYEGPWNSKDVAEFNQDLKAYPDYFTVEASFKNKGIEHANGALELPALYMSAGFRRYAIQFGSNSQVSGIFPIKAPEKPPGYVTINKTAEANPRSIENWAYYTNHETNWVTFSHAEDASQVYTLAWFVAPELRQYKTADDVVQFQQTMFNVKFNTQVFFKAVPNVKFRINYAVFPFAINEAIRFRGSQKTVLEAIRILKNEVEGAPSTAPANVAPAQPTVVATTPTAVTATSTVVASAPVAVTPVASAPSVVVTAPTEAPAVAGPAPQFNVATATNVDAGGDPRQAIDNNLASAYSSVGFSNAIPGNNMQLHVSYANGAKHSGSAILLQAKMEGYSAVGFPKVYNVYFEENGQWVPIAIGLTWAPNAEGRVLIPLNRTVQTNGVLIIPWELGQDSQGTYRFQMSDIWLR